MINDNVIREPRTTPDWSVWGWLGLLVVVATHAFGMFVATAFVTLGTQGACRQAATPDDLASARVVLLVLVAVAAVPWLTAAIVACLRQRPWLRYAVAGVVVTLYPAYFLLSAWRATPADWTSSWCLF